MANQEWKKNLGFLESIMFDPVTSGILGLGEGIMSLFGVSEKNSQIDALKDDYEKMKYSEDAMSRRQSDVKRLYGNSVDSMIGAGGLLNGDTAREIAKTKTFMESAKAILDQRMKDEQVNLGITDKINQLESQKSGYIPSVMGMLSGGLQGVFGATQSSMAMDQKEQQNDLLRDLMDNKDGVKPQGSNLINNLTSGMNDAQKLAQQKGIEERLPQYFREALDMKNNLGISDSEISSRDQSYWDNKNSKGNYNPNLNVNTPSMPKPIDYFNTSDSMQVNPFDEVIKKFTRTGEQVNKPLQKSYLDNELYPDEQMYQSILNLLPNLTSFLPKKKKQSKILGGI